MSAKRQFRLAWHEADGKPWMKTKPQTKRQVLSAVADLLNTRPISKTHAIEISIQRLTPNATSTHQVMPTTTSFRNPLPVLVATNAKQGGGKNRE